MTDENEPIEGEYTEPGRAVAERSESRQAAVFNPLDAEPVSFANQLQTRQENYDALQMHLRGVLVPDKDFGRLHVASRDKCPEPWRCSPEQSPGHWSGYQLLASGADKVLGILGLAVHYPDLQDYKRATLKGYVIKEVIIDCQIVGHAGQVIAEGAGACSRDEANMGGDLNRTIKRACKRARVDAVHRLPVVSALFEADFLAQVAESAKRNKGNSTAGRQQRPKNRYDTGADLEFCPISKNYKGKRWREIPTEALEWMEANIRDKPDVCRAVARELSKRRDSAAGSGSTRTESPPASTDDMEDYLDGTHPKGAR